MVESSNFEESKQIKFPDDQVYDLGENVRLKL